MEMQFYPPGWVLISNSLTQWTSALNIDSLSSNGEGVPTEYGSMALELFYPGPNNQPSVRVEDYRRILSSNPCPASGGVGND
jgi:hypothetical protein